tara:strand:- start:4058 stop:4441 length:384 start_codon:yes stop_codon:yes gene_type:complete
MARFYDPTYDPQRDSGTSGAERSDLNPEQAYDTDLRRVNPDERESVDSLNDKQDRVARFMKSARAAGEYKQRSGFAEPMIRGRTPIGKASIDGVELPSQRTSNFGGPGAGATEYAHKPKPNFGKPFV